MTICEDIPQNGTNGFNYIYGRRTCWIPSPPTVRKCGLQSFQFYVFIFTYRILTTDEVMHEGLLGKSQTPEDSIKIMSEIGRGVIGKEKTKKGSYVGALRHKK